MGGCNGALERWKIWTRRLEVGEVECLGGWEGERGSGRERERERERAREEFKLIGVEGKRGLQSERERLVEMVKEGAVQR